MRALLICSIAVPILSGCAHVPQSTDQQAKTIAPASSVTPNTAAPAAAAAEVALFPTPSEDPQRAAERSRIEQAFLATRQPDMLGVIHQAVAGIEFESPEKVLVRYRGALQVIDPSGVAHPIPVDGGWPLPPEGAVELIKRNGTWVIDIPESMPQALRETLARDFTMPEGSKISEEQTYLILEGFASTRAPNERPSKITPTGPNTAEVSFFMGGIHGGGTAEMAKIDGRWTVTRKFWPY